MELKWLDDFVTLAKAGSFSRSARERNVTQPAFSRRIRALEAWLGVALVDRSTQPLCLTPAGRTFLAAAEQVAGILHRQRILLQSEFDNQAIITVAAPQSLSAHFFPRLLSAIEESVGELRIHLLSDDLHRCVEVLTHDACDFLLAFECDNNPLMLDPNRFQYLRLAVDQLTPVISPDREAGAGLPLPDTGPIEAPLLVYASDSYLGRVLGKLMAARGATARRIVHEDALSDGLKALALSGRGVAWLLESSVQSELADGRLKRAGAPHWSVPLEVRLYRSTSSRTNLVNKVWTACYREQIGSCADDMGAAN